MAGHKYQLAELMTYAYCSMQYHLRYELKIPWILSSPEAAFAHVAREATREYFRCLMVPSLRRLAQRNAAAVLESGSLLLAKRFPRAAILSRRIEHYLAMSKVEDLFVAGRDAPIGFDIPADIVVPMGPDAADAIQVEGVVDFAFWKEAGTSSEHMVAVTIVSDEDPLEDFVNIEPLRAAFAVQVVRDGKYYDIRVDHKALPIFDRTKQSKPMTSRERSIAFGRMIRAIDRGISNRVFVPQASPTKCLHCPYVSVCSAALVDETSAEALNVPQVADPFMGWLGRKS